MQHTTNTEHATTPQRTPTQPFISVLSEETTPLRPPAKEGRAKVSNLTRYFTANTSRSMASSWRAVSAFDTGSLLFSSSSAASWASRLCCNWHWKHTTKQHKIFCNSSAPTLQFALETHNTHNKCCLQQHSINSGCRYHMKWGLTLNSRSKLETPRCRQHIIKQSASS